MPEFGLDLGRDGFSWEILPTSQTSELRRSCQDIFRRDSQKFGIRNAVGVSPELSSLVDRYMRPIAQRHLHPGAFLVRSTLFDKPHDANWAVPWHQDVTIEVKEQIDLVDFGPWSVKDGLISVQPPASVLEKILTLRLHFDDTDQTNGALMVEPGSHRLGKLRIDEIVSVNPVSCNCRSNDVLLMKPLLFHASNRSISKEPRRVLHLDFAFEPLPAPLMWRRP